MPHIENQPQRQVNVTGGEFTDLLNDPQIEKRANESAKLQHKQKLERRHEHQRSVSEQVH